MANTIRQVRPTTQAPSASAPPGMFDAEFAAAGNLGSQISQFGSELGDQAVRIGQMQEQEEFSNASVDYDTDLTTRRIELDQDPDLASHGKKITDWHDMWWSERMKGVMNNNARDRLDLYSRSTRSVSQRRVTFEAARKLESRTRGLLGFKADSYAQREVAAPTPKLQREVRKEWNDYLNSLTGTGTITADEAEFYNTRYGDAIQKLQEEILEEMKIEDFVAAREQAMQFETVEDATTFIDGLTGEFTSAERNDLIAQVKRKFGYRTAQATEALENKRKADRQTIVNKFIATDFTNIEAEINKTDLTPEEKISWIEKADARAKAIAAGEKDPFEETDSNVYFDIRRRIAVPTEGEEVTEKELAELVGKGAAGEFGLPTAAEQKENALTGELGQIKSSSEISITVTDPRLNNGKPTNIPTLVKGQIKVDELADTLKPTKEQEEIAIKRAAKRVAAGANLPSFDTIEEAVAAARARSDSKGAGGGLSITDYEKLLGMITDDPEKPEEPLNRSSAKRAQQVIDRIRSRALLLAKEDEDLDPETIDFNSLQVQNELDAWIVANTDDKGNPTDEAIEKKAQALVRPAVEDITLGFFENVFSPKKKGGFFRSEAEELAQERVQQLEKQAAFKRLTDAEQRQAISLIESGLSVEQAFREIEEPVPVITTKAQQEKLAKGTRYKDSKGNIAVKQ